MKSYPYIGQGTHSGSVALMLGEDECITIDSKTWASKNNQFESGINGSLFKNITREHLEGKCVKIESPEHSEFVQKLAFNAGFKLFKSFNAGDAKESKYLFFYSDNEMTCGNENRDWDEITIPLPPKAEPEHEEWPAVGSKVFVSGLSDGNRCYDFNGDTVTILGINDFDGRKLFTFRGNLRGVGALLEGDWMKKPKTEAEILRDDIFQSSGVRSRDGGQQIANDVADFLTSKYNITKKPQ